jgi:hypothetical protein
MVTLHKTRRCVSATLAAVVASAVLASCGGGSSTSKSFTIKLDHSGQVFYLVMSASGHEVAIAHAMTKKLASTMGSSWVVSVTSTRPHGSLACIVSGKIGENGSPPPILEPYRGENISMKLYGSGPLADGFCSGLKSSAG